MAVPEILPLVKNCAEDTSKPEDRAVAERTLKHHPQHYDEKLVLKEWAIEEITELIKKSGGVRPMTSSSTVLAVCAMPTISRTRTGSRASMPARPSFAPICWAYARWSPSPPPLPSRTPRRGLT